ncbi:MAG TPA: hypothetical protein VFA49_15140, partial [Chloroflexota bacterium]|nr:hypothetical protein [Chloroflexota bacterium]
MPDENGRDAPLKSAYDLWQEGEGAPIYRGYFVEDLYTVEVGDWPRFGVKGAMVNLAQQVEDDAWVLEIAPGGETNPARHVFEAMMYVLSGRGNARVFSGVEGQEPRVFEFGRGSVFAIPLNAS